MAALQGSPHPGPLPVRRGEGESFFKHHVRVGAPDAERTHPGAARRLTWRPFRELRIDVERAARERDFWIRRLEVEAGRQHFMVQGQHRLDQAGHARGRIQMADVALDRTDAAELSLAPGSAGLLAGAEGLDQPLDFHRVAQRGRNDLRLALDARSGVTDLVRAVVVDGEPFDYGENLVPFCQRLFQAFQHHDACALAGDRPRGLGVKRAAMPVGRGDTPFLIEIAAFLGKADRNRPR